jgi:hypothetical protein
VVRSPGVNLSSEPPTEGVSVTKGTERFLLVAVVVLLLERLFFYGMALMV